MGLLRRQYLSVGYVINIIILRDFFIHATFMTIIFVTKGALLLSSFKIQLKWKLFIFKLMMFSLSAKIILAKFWEIQHMCDFLYPFANFSLNIFFIINDMSKIKCSSTRSSWHLKVNWHFLFYCYCIEFIEIPFRKKSNLFSYAYLKLSFCLIGTCAVINDFEGTFLNTFY